MRHLRLLIPLVPPLIALFVWGSALSFVPVPWPDDSAFYFVAKDLFRWPPRWVMLPQAPFEPTYAIYNFNTMPLYPILIGLGRFIGIDGSFALKLWPLAAWAAGGYLLTHVLLRQGLPALAALFVALAYSLDPGMRWASVLVRPESLIGLCGVALVLGLSIGFPKRFKPTANWDPCAALLAIGAYAHFNAVYLVPIVLVGLRHDLRRLFDIGWKTTLYLVPWMITVAIHPKLFVHQMALQWRRLAVGNPWLDSVKQAISGVYQDLGSPEPWPDIIWYGALLIWAIAILALIGGLLYPLVREAFRRADRSLDPLAPAAAWILSSGWLWYSKPEVWFTFYIHIAVWTFCGVAALVLWRRKNVAALAVLFTLIVPATAVFAVADFQQWRSLSSKNTWTWSRYHSWIDCIDQELVKLESDLNHPKPFRVWAPTWPDVTIELSRRHPEWELSRTNDFNDRNHLAIRHAHDVEAVVVAETLNWEERDASEPLKSAMATSPPAHSLWLNWKDYFLYQLWDDPKWKPDRRYYCQRGRWQAFVFGSSAPGPAPH